MHFRQGVWLDQQTLSFVAAPCLAEAHHHSMPCTFRLDAARHQRIPGRQELKIVETGASQARRAGVFHDEKITRSAAAVAFPGIVQWLDHHKLGRAARPLRQTLPLFLGKLA